jgi:hypothetical protein
VRAGRGGDRIANGEGDGACDNFWIMALNRRPAGRGAPATGKRLRGWFIRLVLNRALSVVLGLLLLAPAVWLFFADYRWETPITDGLQLIVGATGAALLFAGIGGRRPDWIEPDDLGP